MRMLSQGTIVLRQIQRSDAAALHQLLVSDRQWLGPWEATLPNQQPNPSAPSLLDIMSSIRSLRKMSRKHEAYPYAIFDDGVLVGQLNVAQIAFGALHSATIGYWVHSSAAGRGIMPTAVALVSDFLMFEQGLHRIEICLVTDNYPSYRVVEKLGFHYEGLRRKYIHINGAWRDHYAFSVTREDFETGQYSIRKSGMLERFLSGEDFSHLAAIPDS